MTFRRCRFFLRCVWCVWLGVREFFFCVRACASSAGSVLEPAEGTRPFFSLLSDPRSRSPSRSPLSSSSGGLFVFVLYLSFVSLINSLPSHTHTSRRSFVHGFLFFFHGCPRKTENIGCAFGTKTTVVGCRGFVPRVSVAHSFDWFVLGCLVVLPYLYDESVFSLKLYPFFFFPHNWTKCLFIRFCSCGCSMSPFFTSQVGHPELFSVLDVILSPRITCIMTKQKKKQLLKDIVQTY